MIFLEKIGDVLFDKRYLWCKDSLGDVVNIDNKVL